MSRAAEPGFELDLRLEADTAFVADWGLSRLLLMDDARFPWLVLVPRRAGVTELDELRVDEQAQLLGEITRAMALLRSVTDACDKLNIGMLGNIVRQLHVHVVARCEGDAAWPGPAWGSGSAVPRAVAARGMLIEKLRSRS